MDFSSPTDNGFDRLLMRARSSLESTPSRLERLCWASDFTTGKPHYAEIRRNCG